jgi:CMP-N,N'-diacetyllegionaminic acid synthase
MRSPNTYAFIPARGGSQRIQNKNLALIAGKPLLAYTIEVAKNCGIFTEVLVNSDDEEILTAAAKLTATPYRRPKHFGGDRVFIIEVLQEMIGTLGLADADVLGILLPTCPLRSEADVLVAYQIFLEQGGEVPVVSVARYDTPIQLAQFIAADGRLDHVFPEDYRKSTRSTDHQDAYHYNEAIIFNSVKNLKSQHNLIGERPIPYVMPPERSIALDYPYQMEMVSLLLARHQK